MIQPYHHITAEKKRAMPEGVKITEDEVDIVQ